MEYTHSISYCASAQYGLIIPYMDVKGVKDFLPAQREGGARAILSRVRFSEKKLAKQSEGAAEGGCGGNSAAPERSAGAKRRQSVPFKVGSSKVQNIPLHTINKPRLLGLVYCM